MVTPRKKPGERKIAEKLSSITVRVLADILRTLWAAMFSRVSEPVLISKVITAFASGAFFVTRRGCKVHRITLIRLRRWARHHYAKLEVVPASARRNMLHNIHTSVARRAGYGRGSRSAIKMLRADVTMSTSVRIGGIDPIEAVRVKPGKGTQAAPSGPGPVRRGGPRHRAHDAP